MYGHLKTQMPEKDDADEMGWVGESWCLPPMWHCPFPHSKILLYIMTWGGRVNKLLAEWCYIQMPFWFELLNDSEYPELGSRYTLQSSYRIWIRIFRIRSPSVFEQRNQKAMGNRMAGKLVFHGSEYHSTCGYAIQGFNVRRTDCTRSSCFNTESRAICWPHSNVNSWIVFTSENLPMIPPDPVTVGEKKMVAQLANEHWNSFAYEEKQHRKYNRN